MFTVFFFIVHASRSATNALSGKLVHRSSSYISLGRRFGSNSSLRTFQNPTLRQNQQTKKHWLSQHQLLLSLSSSSNEDIHNSNTDGPPMMGIPSMEQLRTDSFMKQVQYAEFITGLIEEDNGRETDVLMNRLRAQLSHPDGIRGFMVTYLTTTTSTTADASDGETSDSGSDSDSTEVPTALIKAIVEQIDPINDTNELISLMCMNVIMPTGMITMQPNEEMSQQSSKTAMRAVQLLKKVLNHCSDSNTSTSNGNKIRSAIMTQCDAILAVATEMTDANSDSKTNSYDKEEKGLTSWRIFFRKWEYQSQQQSDIANAIRSVLLQ